MEPRIYENKLEKIKQRSKEIELALSDPAVIKDQDKFQKMSKELAGIRPVVDAYKVFKRLKQELSDVEKALERGDSDSEMKALYEEEARDLSEEMEKVNDEIETLLLREKDPHSNRDVIIEIRAGTGGEEASLFAANLFRMYSRYGANHKLKCEVMSASETGKGGFKEIIFSLGGAGSYSKFKYESGIHRVQRVPETESSGRIHTSAVTVAVLPEVDDKEIEIESKDLRIDVFRASGAGGQHVNKTESAVRITHIPTGVVVSCQDERSQHKNKAKAMRVLRARIFSAREAEQHQAMAKQRKDMVGSGDRSGKIRTYNFPDQRVTDHRIGLTLHELDDILNGHLEPLVQALERHEREKKLTDAA